MQPDFMETTPVTQPPKEPRRRSLVGPVILIMLGLAFLVSNLGLFNVNVWEMLWRLWPVWLIAVGLDLIIGRRTAWGSWIVIGLLVTMIGGAVWFFNSGLGWVGTGGQPVETRDIAVALDGARDANVTIRPGVGEFEIGSMSSDQNLVQGTVYRLPGERIMSDAQGSNGHMAYTLRSEGSFAPTFDTNIHGPTWDLLLNEKVPMDLTIGTGVGKATVDLTRLNLTSLTLSTGIGESRFMLPEKGSFNVQIKTGIGKTVIDIPRSLGARVRVQSGIGHVGFSGDFRTQDGYYVTSNYDSAQDRVEVHISGGIGEIQIRER